MLVHNVRVNGCKPLTHIDVCGPEMAYVAVSPLDNSAQDRIETETNFPNAKKKHYIHVT